LEKAVVINNDLITLNIVLPDANGFELCSILNQHPISRRTPVLFISASPCQQDIDEAKRRGAVDYIIKPFDVTELIHQVVFHTKANPKQTEAGV
jgi:PleD family two-component response regulator